MRTLIHHQLTAAALAAAVIAPALLAPSLTRADEACKAVEPITESVEAPGCACPPERHDTVIDWHADPSEAARLARERGKLLLVMHLSGELPDAGLT